MKTKQKNKTTNTNYILLILFAIMLIFGLVMLASASQIKGLRDFGDSYYFLKHQILYGIIPGIIIFIIISNIKYTVWEKYSLIIFGLSILSLVLVLIPQLGFSHGGAKRWLYLGPIHFQPSEFVKLSSIIFLSSWIIKRKDKLNDFYYSFIPFCIYISIISILIALEPDIGTLFVIVLTSISIYFIGGGKIKHLVLFTLIAPAVFIILVKTSPYRLNRITAFLNPESDKLGISYQINQSMIAIGSGGLLGRGLGQSKQKYQYLPEVAGDSIFAVVAEELGFIVTTLFLIFYLLFIMSIFKISKKAKNEFGKYVSFGIAVWFATQSFVNIGAMIKLLPLTGLPLPFISYGSSAFVASISALGIVINISKNN